ncbi:MAG: division/cell wall cluster transcriptional repressor MraZ, partial [Thiohalomonadales bacterium]
HLIITVDHSQCLLIYPLPDWEVVEQKLAKLSSFNKHSRRLQRLLLGHATDVDMDSSGRLLVPPPLRKYASIEKQVVLTGQGNKFELWDEKKWNTNCEEWMNDDDFNQDLPEELQNFSL